MKSAGHQTLKRWAYALGEPLLQQASRAYVPGPRLEDAVQWARERAPAGCGFTFGYFNADEEPAAQVEQACSQSITALSGLSGLSGQAALTPAAPNTNGLGYCSLKVPSLGYEAGALQRLARQAAAHGQRLHFDSHGPETTAPTLAALEALRPHHPRLGLTVPGRWTRSLQDADWAAQRGLRVRVVKGQWPCHDQPGLDPRQGFLAVIDRLAGSVSEVAVATHDAVLAGEAVRRLAARGTACELELLCGLPRRGVLELAHSRHLPVRLYVPFGQAWLPYALSQVLRKPGMWPRLLKDSLAEVWPRGAK
jgi:proline dehydrogenase